MSKKSLITTVFFLPLISLFAAQPGRYFSGDYLLNVNNKPIDVYMVPMPEKGSGGIFDKLNWQPYSYATFVSTGAVEVTVQSALFDLSKVQILPKSKCVTPTKKTKSSATFRMTAPMTLVLEPNGRHRALVISANLPEKNASTAQNKHIKFFAPGYHLAGEIKLKSDETLYLAPGAWVEGYVQAFGKNINICGSGVLSGSNYNWLKGPKKNMVLMSGEDITVRDVTLFSAWCWTLNFNAATNVLVDNVKIVCGRVINDDGIDVCRSKDVVIRNSFVRCQDDCLAVKWWCENLVCTNMVFWGDAANIVRTGYECESKQSSLIFKNHLIKDIDILHLTLNHRSVDNYWANCAFYLQASHGQTMSDLVFEDIRINECCKEDIFIKACTMPIVGSISSINFAEPGIMKNILFKNIKLPDSNGGMCIYLSSHDKEHPIENIRLENVSGYGPITKKGNVDFRVK
jgi:hypothetical protein